MSLIDQYIDSLAKHLGRNRSETKAQIAEIRTHLEMDTRDRIESGSSRGDAELAACNAMGSPQVIANQIIRQARGYATAPAWRLAWQCGLFLTMAMVIPYSMLGNIHYQGTAESLVRWAPFFALVFFGLRIVQTKRWLVKPMAAWAALASVGVLVGSIWVTNPSPTPAQLEMERANVQRELARVEAEQKLVDLWKGGNPPLDKAPLVGAADASVVIPFVPFAFGGTDQSVNLEASSPGEAVARWSKYGAIYATDVQDRRRDMAKLPLSGRPIRALSEAGSAIRLTTMWALFTAYQILVFLIVNAGILALIRIREKQKARREPLFA